MTSPDNQRRELEQIIGPVLFKFGVAIREICGKKTGEKLIDLLDPFEQELFGALDTYIAAQVRESQIDQHNRTSEMYVYENAKRERKRLSAKEKL